MTTTQKTTTTIGAVMLIVGGFLMYNGKKIELPPDPPALVIKKSWPTSPASFVQTTTELVVTVPGSNGMVYEIQSATNLPATTWHPRLTVQGQGVPVYTYWPCTNDQEYFRWVATPSSDLWFTLPNTDASDVVEAIAGSPDGTIVVAANRSGVNLCLIKYTTAGVKVWEKIYFGTVAPRGITTDSAGNIYVTGFYVGSQSVGGPTLPGSLSARFIFIAKYDSAGNHLWSRGIGGGFGNSSGNAIALRGSQVIVAGYAAGGDFGDGVVLGNSGGTAFVAAYDLSGAFIWKQYYGATLSAVNAMGVSGDGIFMTGFFFQSMNLGGVNLAASAYAGWVGRVNGSGTYAWGRSFGAFPDNNYRYGGNGLAIGGTNVYLTGTYVGTVNFGCWDHTSSTSSFFDVVFAKLELNGLCQWSKTVSSSTASTGWGLAANANADGVMFTGRFYGVSDFGNGQIATHVGTISQPNTFVARYTPAGTCLNVRSLGGNNQGHTVLLGSGAFAGGWYIGNTTFAGEHSSIPNPQGAPSQDGYLIKLQ